MKKGLKLFATGFVAMTALSIHVKADTIKDEEQLATCLAKESATCTIASKELEITKSHKITTGSDVIVDLNGNKVIGPDDGKANWYAFIVDGGKLTLKDSSEAQTGELWAKCYGVETKTGIFVMESGKITATNNPTVGAAIVNYGGKAEVKGGTLVAASNWAVNAQSYFSDSELVISGGNFEITAEDTATIQIGGEYTKGKETVTITGGTFKGKTAFAVSEKANATVSITGGSFSTDVAEHVSDGYKTVEEEKMFVVKPIVYEVTKGEDQEVTVEKGTEITITIDAEFDKFKDLYINDKLVDKKYYEAKSGSTIITLKPEFTETLEKGNYEVKATFTDGGTATTKITLVSNKVIEEAAKSKNENPKTSDNIITYFIAMIISVFGLAITTVCLKKSKKALNN